MAAPRDTYKYRYVGPINEADLRSLETEVAQLFAEVTG